MITGAAILCALVALAILAGGLQEACERRAWWDEMPAVWRTKEAKS